MTKLNKYRELLLYLLFGACTVGVNTGVYTLCLKVFHIHNVFSVIIAWFVAVLFAFFTNRKFVFAVDKTDRRSMITECFRFFICRLLSGILDVAIMAIAVSWLQGNSVFWKLLSNIAVIIANYLGSKFWVFSEDKKKNKP